MVFKVSRLGFHSSRFFMVPGWFYGFSCLQVVFYGSGWFFMVSGGFYGVQSFQVGFS